MGKNIVTGKADFFQLSALQVGKNTFGAVQLGNCKIVAGAISIPHNGIVPK